MTTRMPDGTLSGAPIASAEWDGTERANPLPPPPQEMLPFDLSAWRKGNTGVDYVHRFESGRPGSHVLINALTHGNEVCGAYAVRRLLTQGVRPRKGTLTVSFANVAAYESFDPEQPFASRLLVHNLNRIWTRDWLDGAERSPELERARQLRPVIEAADHVLDLHSTQNDVEPFWLYSQFPRNDKTTTAIGFPAIHVIMPQGTGFGVGTPLIQWGRHGAADGHGVATVAECGQHFLRATSERAIRITLSFLAHFGLIAPDEDLAQVQAEPARKLLLLSSHVVRTKEFRFVRPLRGFEVFQQGELIATDGDEEIRAPCDQCTVVLPARHAIVGREGVYLTRRL